VGGSECCLTKRFDREIVNAINFLRQQNVSAGTGTLNRIEADGAC